ncbi:uncharacterized protein LOC115243305 isoform X2 [Formica exsecta]|uniref:uncharacterized protein LOC115243305 isoform X2 n=1 Tax=Formica exsecta TaxID=72781 RepID=UPI0011445EE7|nr:uncharacterized protein LOC115243305 isoform X2 [Formica exsecta]
MAEETTASTLLTRLKGYLKEAPFFCKIIELIFCVIATGLVAGPFQQNQIRPADIHHIAIFHVAVCGYVLINAILIMSHLLGERLPKKTQNIKMHGTKFSRRCFNFLDRLLSIYSNYLNSIRCRMTSCCLKIPLF